MKLDIQPATPERWPELEQLFKAKGRARARGCWCMAYRHSGVRTVPPEGLTHATANRAALKALVDARPVPGLIGYRAKVPVGWVSLAPREEFARLARSTVMKLGGDRADPRAPGLAGPGATPGSGTRPYAVRCVIAARRPGLR